MPVSSVVSDEEIAAHHFGRFGDADPREIVNEGVLKAALGWASGSTVTTILRRHRLVDSKTSATGAPRLTKKGISYAREMFAGTDLREMARSLTRECR